MTLKMNLAGVTRTALLGLTIASTSYGQLPDGITDILAKRNEMLSTIERDARDRANSANRAAVEKLGAYAKTAISTGDVERATNAWKEVLRIDPKNAGAITFFKTLRILPQIQEEIAKERADKVDDGPEPDQGAPAVDAAGNEVKQNAPPQGRQQQQMFAAVDWRETKPAKILIEGNGYSVAPFRSKAKMYVNRDQYGWKQIPEAMRDWAFTTGSVGSPPKIGVRVLEGGWVFVLISLQHVFDPMKPENKELLSKAGWKPIVLASSPFGKYLCLGRPAKKGDRFTIPHFHTFEFSHLVHPDDRLSP